MARSFSRAGPQRPVPQRRKRVWATADQTYTAVDGTTQTQSLLAQFASDYGADLVGGTVARTFLAIRYIAVTPPVASGLTVAVIMTHRGVTASSLNPTGIGTRHLDWSYLSRHFYIFDPMNGIGEARIDIKAMRKMEEIGAEYHLVLQAGSGDSFNVQVHARTLLMLP